MTHKTKSITIRIPESWLDAFIEHSTGKNLSLSRFMLEASRSKLPKAVRDALPIHKPIGRPHEELSDLSPTQKRMVQQLINSPLAWVGSSIAYKPVVILPEDGGLFGLSMSISTENALLRKGYLVQGRLSEKQMEEHKKRKWNSRISTPTHGRLYTGKGKPS